MKAPGQGATVIGKLPIGADSSALVWTAWQLALPGSYHCWGL